MTEDFRKEAPKPLEMMPFGIAKPREATLSNGLKALIYEDKRVPLVNFRLAFRSGEASEPRDNIGITSAMAELLSQGTTKRNSREFAEEIEKLGAGLGANSSLDSFVVSASSLSAFSEKILSLMAEMVFSPEFAKNEIALYQQNLIEGLKYQRSQPSFLGNELAARIIYGSHPYSVVSPDENDIPKINRENLFKAHKRVFVPANAVILAVGDIEASSFIEQLEAAFGGWKGEEMEAPEFPGLPERNGTTVSIVHRAGSAQSNIILCNPAIRRDHPDFYAVQVMNQILGAGASSRIFMNIREDKGYTYGAYSSFDMRRMHGTFEATAEVRSEVTGDSLVEFFYELNRIRDEKVSNQELADAKSFLTGVFPIRAETQGGLMRLLIRQQLYGLAEDYLDTYRDKISQITTEDVSRVANSYVLPESMAIVIVGDAAQVIPQIGQYSKAIEVFDTEGNEIEKGEFING